MTPMSQAQRGVIALFACLVLWLGLRGSWERPQQYEAHQQQSAAKSNAENPKVSTDERLANYTLAVAILTGVLAASTIGLWVATVALYAAGERHSERELRAYIVGTTSCKIRGFNTPKPICTLAFKNSGQTPAYNVRIWTSSAVAVYPMENPPVRPDGEPGEGASVGVVGPGDDFWNEIQSDIEITQAERAEVIGERCAYYVYGQISYRNSFGVERNSTFCRFFAGDRARRNDGPLATYYKWNEAT